MKQIAVRAVSAPPENNRERDHIVMGLFRKKAKEEPAQELSKNKQQGYRREIQEFAADFLPEEITLLAVTAPAGTNHEKVGDSDLWHVSMGLTAWMDQYADEIELGHAKLEAMLDGQLLGYLLERIPRNFVISAVVRPNADGSRFLMLDLPTPTFDPDLNAIAEKQKEPVTIDVEGLGCFQFNFNLGWFETLTDWAGSEITLTFNQDEAGRQSSIDTARALMEQSETWDSKLCAFAADQLLSRACELMDGESFSREDFLALMECDCILALPDGNFEVWYGGEDFFMTYPVHLTGNLTDGPLFAEFEESDI